MKPTIELHFSTEYMNHKAMQCVYTSYDANVNDVVEELKEEGHTNINFEFKYWTAYAWPGGYPLYYITEDCGILCPKCANENLALTLSDYPEYKGANPEWEIVASEINWEDGHLFCDHCNDNIKPAYEKD